MEATAPSADMARFRSRLGEVLGMAELRLDTPVNKAVIRSLESLMEGEMASEALELFLKIELAVQEAMDTAKKCRSIAVMARKVKPKLHRFRAFSLAKMLGQLKKSQPSFPDNPFLWQILIDKCYMAVLSSIDTTTEVAAPPRRLRAVELNAIRYAAGFVVRKLRKKYAKQRGGEQFSDTLKRMVSDESDLQVDDVDAETFEEYSKLWLRKTDRGGLTHVDDTSFWLFQEIELVIYSELKRCYSRQEQSASSIAAAAIKDEDASYIWSIIATCLTGEQFQQLLTAIVMEWVVLRGHCLRNVFMETYKRMVSDEKRQKKSLRKELKRKHQENS